MGKTYTKYEINEKFFDNFSKEMAYVLGYILTDGCIRSHRRFTIDSSDIQILKDISKAMNSNIPIKKESNKNGSWYKLSINRKYMLNKLVELGIGKDKTYNSHMLDIPQEYMRDFIRGVFDGDGSIYSYYKTDNRNKKLYTYRKAQIEIASASKTFINDLLVFLNKNVGHFTKHNSTQSNVMTVRSGYKIEDFYEYIYYDNCLRLERKKEKFDEEIELRNKSPKCRKVRVRI